MAPSTARRSTRSRRSSGCRRQDASNVGRIFDAAKQDADGFEPYAQQVGILFRGEPAVLEDLLASLFFIARADGDIKPAEIAFLRRVGDLFGLDAGAFERVRAMFVRPEAADPYGVLGLSRTRQRRGGQDDLSAADPRASSGHADRQGPAEKLHRGGEPEDGGDQCRLRPDRAGAGAAIARMARRTGPLHRAPAGALGARHRCRARRRPHLGVQLHRRQGGRDAAAAAAADGYALRAGRGAAGTFLQAAGRGAGGSIAAISVVLGGMHFGLMFAGLRGVDAGPAAIAIQLTVPFSALLAAVFYRERLGSWQTAGMLVAFAGVYLLAGEPSRRPSALHFLMVVCAAFAWAVANVLIKRLGPINVFTLNAWVALLACPQLLLASLLLERGQAPAIETADWRAWGAVVYMAVGASIIAYGLWYYLIEKHELNRVVPLTLLSPVLAVALAVPTARRTTDRACPDRRRRHAGGRRNDPVPSPADARAAAALMIAEFASPNFDERPADTPIDMLVLHYTGMQNAADGARPADRARGEGQRALPDRRRRRRRPAGARGDAGVARRRFLLARRDRHQCPLDRHRAGQPRARVRLPRVPRTADGGASGAGVRHRRPASDPAAQRRRPLRRGPAPQDGPRRTVRLAVPGARGHRALARGVRRVHHG